MAVVTRTCRKCAEEKDIESFGKYNNGTNEGRRRVCEACRYKRAKEKGYATYKHKTTRQQRKHEIKYRYGITEEELGDMYKAQEGKCLICKQHEDTVGTLNIDHCHTTGKVRGLLCKRCNMGIGYFKDNVELLRKAAKYLEK